MFSWDDKLHRNDPLVKKNNPIKYILLNPYLSPSHPEVGSMTAIASIYAVITHCILLSPTPREAIIFGRPVFTTVASRTAIKVPNMTFTRRNHLYDTCLG
jgi:hypothetical protein